jgi:signal transduction histidine kinase
VIVRPSALARRMGLRARLTLTATAVVAVTLAASGVLLLLAVRYSVLHSLDDSARQQAKDVAALAQSGRLPDPVPVGAGTAGVQVVDDQGRVMAVSAGADRLTALLVPSGVRAVRSGQVLVIDGARLGTPDSLRVVGYPVPARNGRPSGQTVLVAVSEAEATGSVRALALATVVGGPVLLAAFAAVCWLLVGRSLQPVSRLRRGAEEIAAAGSADDRRLPVPPAQDEVRRLAETLNGMLDRLEGSATAQRAFVADAAHELRSPLTAIRTQLEVARRHPDLAPWDETAAGVLADTDRLARLVDDLLLLARGGDAGDPAGRRRERVDVLAAAARVASRPWPVPVDLLDGSGDGAVDGAVDGAGGAAAPVWADPDAVTRILVNLVDNATRFARSRVCVGVDLVAARAGDQGRERVEVVVDDDGPGIDPADRERAFERFARLDDARARADGGTGLGLAIVRELVRSSGGEVHLTDPPARDGRTAGTRAVVSWPAAPGSG